MQSIVKGRNVFADRVVELCIVSAIDFLNDFSFEDEKESRLACEWFRETSEDVFGKEILLAAPEFHACKVFIEFQK